MSNKDEIKVDKIEEVKEVREDIKEEKVQDNVIENKSEEKNEEKKASKENIEDTNPSLLKRIFASILDEAILFGISVVALLIFDLLIKLIGYMVVDPVPMLFVAFAVLNIIYFPLFERKGGKTLGKSILAIR